MRRNKKKQEGKEIMAKKNASKPARAASKTSPAKSRKPAAKSSPQSRKAKTTTKAATKAPANRKATPPRKHTTSPSMTAPGKSSVREISKVAAQTPTLPEHILRDDPGIEKL